MSQNRTAKLQIYSVITLKFLNILLCMKNINIPVRVFKSQAFLSQEIPELK